MSHPVDARHPVLHPDVATYLAALTAAPDPLVERMEQLARVAGFPLVGRQAGRWLELLARMVGARRVLELGSGWGYSAYWLARGVGPDGLVLGSEGDAGLVEQHRELFAGHPLRQRIQLQHGDALDILRDSTGVFDLIFVDIEKEDYLQALALAVPRLRSGGLLVADNVLWGGKVCREASPGDEATQSLRRFNERLHSDPRLEAAILPADDGLAVAWVR
jgi:caffeoyl-CoA O-methyltransferase